MVLCVFNVFGFFAFGLIKSISKYNQERTILFSEQPRVDWQIEGVRRNTSLKVVVIGESVNRRYLSVMGSRWDTTPFLAGSNQVAAYTQYYAPGPNTVSSLVRTFSYSSMEDGSFDQHRNVVALARAAGYATHWISNQHTLGPRDTLVAKMGRQADTFRFLRQGAIVEPARDDFALLNYLRSLLDKPGAIEPDSVIFLHMMGSHPYVCTKVRDMRIAFESGQGQNVDCYLTSLVKLDNFLHELSLLLKKYQPSYDIIFVSDHSLRVAPLSETERWMDRIHFQTKNIHVEPNVREAYETALLRIDSGREQALHIETPLSGFDFFHLYANWLGVQGRWVRAEKNLDQPVSSAPIRVFDWKNMVPAESLPDEPPLLPAK